MKNLILALPLLALLAACGSNNGATNVAAAKPDSPSTGVIKNGLKWEPLTVNGDGQPAVVDGYRVESINESTGFVSITDVHDVTVVASSTLALADGKWCARVIAYNGAGDAPASNSMCFTVRNGKFFP